VPWWTGLAPETIRQLHDRYPELTLEQIAIEAMRRPGYADEFARLGAEVVDYDPAWADPDGPIIGSFLRSPDDYPEVYVPEDAREAFRDLVVAAMLKGEKLIDPDHSRTTGRPPAGGPARPRPLAIAPSR
jgi:hypothetical protein